MVAQGVTPAAKDVKEREQMVTAVITGLRRKPTRVLADAGYWSEANIVALERRGIEPFIATKRDPHTEPPGPAPRGRPPAGLTVRERMARKLPTPRGRPCHATRKPLVR